MDLSLTYVWVTREVEADGEGVGQGAIEIEDDPPRSVAAIASVIHAGDSTSRHLPFASPQKPRPKPRTRKAAIWARVAASPGQ